MTVKVTYFDIEGYGEPIRLSLKLAGVDFEDKKVLQDEWATLKPQMPNGALPILEVGDVVMTQTHAIVRYIGRKYGLLPTDPEKQYDCDQIIENCMDVYKSLSKILYVKMFPEKYGFENCSEEDQTNRIDNIKYDILDGTLTKMLDRIDKSLQRTEFLTTGKITSADIWAFTCYRFVSNFENGIPEDCADHCKNIMTLKEKFIAMPIIREHYNLPLIMLTGTPNEGLEAPIRLALKFAKVDFEDRKLSSNKWVAIRHTSPDGNLPYLTVNGRSMLRVFSIMRYLGTKFDMQPVEARECYKVDEVFETCSDVQNTYMKSFEIAINPNKFGWNDYLPEQIQQVVKKIRQNACAGPLPFALERQGKVLSSCGILAGKKVTVSDLYAYCSQRSLRLGYISDIPVEIFNNVQSLVEFMEEMEKLPEIQEHFGI